MSIIGGTFEIKGIFAKRNITDLAVLMPAIILVGVAIRDNIAAI